MFRAKSSFKGRYLSAVIISAALLIGNPVVAKAEVVMKMASATINDVQHQWQKTFAPLRGFARVGDYVCDRLTH